MYKRTLPCEQGVSRAGHLADMPTLPLEWITHGFLLQTRGLATRCPFREHRQEVFASQLSKQRSVSAWLYHMVVAPYQGQSESDQDLACRPTLNPPPLQMLPHGARFPTSSDSCPKVSTTSCVSRSLRRLQGWHLLGLVGEPAAYGYRASGASFSISTCRFTGLT